MGVEYASWQEARRANAMVGKMVELNIAVDLGTEISRN
jgi:hypothetical protein